MFQPLHEWQFEVVKWQERTCVVKIKDKEKTISVDHLKLAYIVEDILSSKHTCQQTAFQCRNGENVCIEWAPYFFC